MSVASLQRGAHDSALSAIEELRQLLKGTADAERGAALLDSTAAALGNLFGNLADGQQELLSASDQTASTLRAALDTHRAEPPPQPTLDFAMTALQEMPPRLRSLLEGKRVLVEQMKQYRRRVQAAEERIQDLEHVQLILTGSKTALQEKLKACSVTPKQLQEFQQLQSQVDARDRTIKNLEYQVATLTKKIQVDERAHALQMRALRRELDEAYLGQTRLNMLYQPSHPLSFLDAPPPDQDQDDDLDARPALHSHKTTMGARAPLSPRAGSARRQARPATATATSARSLDAGGARPWAQAPQSAKWPKPGSGLSHSQSLGSPRPPDLPPPAADGVPDAAAGHTVATFLAQQLQEVATLLKPQPNQTPTLLTGWPHTHVTAPGHTWQRASPQAAAGTAFPRMWGTNGDPARVAPSNAYASDTAPASRHEPALTANPAPSYAASYAPGAGDQARPGSRGAPPAPAQAAPAAAGRPSSTAAPAGPAGVGGVAPPLQYPERRTPPIAFSQTLQEYLAAQPEAADTPNTLVTQQRAMELMRPPDQAQGAQPLPGMHADIPPVTSSYEAWRVSPAVPRPPRVWQQA